MPRRRMWIDMLINTSVSNTGAAVISMLGVLSPEETQEMTVERMLLCYSMLPSTPGANNGAMFLDLGIGVTSKEAFAAGVVADPNTATDFPMAGYLYRCRHGIIDSIDSKDGPVVEINKDVRAKRKIARGELYVNIVNNSWFATTFSVRICGIFRTLVLLP